LNSSAVGIAQLVAHEATLRGSDGLFPNDFGEDLLLSNALL